MPAARAPMPRCCCSCLVGCLPLHRVYGLAVLRQPRRLLLAVLPVAVVFAAWDIAATAAGHWHFDPAQTLAVRDRRPAAGGVRLLPRHPAGRDPHLRGGGRRPGAPPPPRRRAARDLHRTPPCVGVVVAVLVDLVVLRTRLLATSRWWMAYAIVRVLPAAHQRLADRPAASSATTRPRSSAPRGSPSSATAGSSGRRSRTCSSGSRWCCSTCAGVGAGRHRAAPLAPPLTGAADRPATAGTARRTAPGGDRAGQQPRPGGPRGAGDHDPARGGQPLPARHAQPAGEHVVLGRDHLGQDLAVEHERRLQAGPAPRCPPWPGPAGRPRRAPGPAVPRRPAARAPPATAARWPGRSAGRPR